jgi:hypothetical protein
VAYLIIRKVQTTSGGIYVLWPKFETDVLRIQESPGAKEGNSIRLKFSVVI